MGEVYEARHARLAGRYAVKVLHVEIRKHPEIFLRFRREAQITSALRHPGIVQVIDFNTTPDGAPYLVMEYLEGKDLGQVITRQGALGVTRAADITSQIARALSAAHRKGVVHRDLKPQNIFLLPADEDEPERAKVLDFGISKIRSVSRKLTGTAVVLGTPQFMAPEQAEGRDEVDAAADQFSLAAIVYEMLTGRPAFSGETLASVVYQIVHVDPVPVTTLRPDLPPAIQQVLARALAKRKQDRFASVREFSRELSRAAWAESGAPVPAGQLGSGRGSVGGGGAGDRRQPIGPADRLVGSEAVASEPADSNDGAGEANELPASWSQFPFLTRGRETLPLGAAVVRGVASAAQWFSLRRDPREDRDTAEGVRVDRRVADPGTETTTTFGRMTGGLVRLRAIMGTRRGKLMAGGFALAGVLGVAIVVAQRSDPRSDPPATMAAETPGGRPTVQQLAGPPRTAAISMVGAGTGKGATGGDQATSSSAGGGEQPPSPRRREVAELAEFELASEPPGLPVRVDDQPFPGAENQGVTRLRGSLPPGPHTFELSKPGFEPWRKQVELRANAPNRFLARLKKTPDPAAIFADLKPSAGGLPPNEWEASPPPGAASALCVMTVGSKPWADLWVDGKNTGRHTPVVELAVPCGVRQVYLRRDDLGIDFQTSVTLTPGEGFRRVFRLDAGR